jgi:hypothetical protein
MTSASDEQKLRKETLLNDRRVREQASTFYQFGASEANEPLGRFAATNKATVVGETPVLPQYAAPVWAPDPCGPEPALGYAIDEQLEPTGTPAEVEASIAKLNEEGHEPDQT